MFNVLTKNFCKTLKIKRPIIQAPMAGSIVTPDFVAEVSNALGLGSLPLGYLSLNEAKRMIHETKLLVANFSVNIFIPSSVKHPEMLHFQKMLAHINSYRHQLGLESLTTIPFEEEPLIDDWVSLIIEMLVPTVSFVFGILDDKNIKRLKQKGIYLIGTATSVKEGLMLQQAGCDAVVAQGYEAGGHRGGFLANHNGLVGTLALVPMMADALTIPVIAAGGIMDGRGIAAAMMLGASAVQMGTAFLTCKESGASALHKQLILQKLAEETCLTNVFTGKQVRCIKNQFVTETERLFQEDEIPVYPIQHELSQELRKIAKKQNNFACAGFWSGQSTRLARALSVKELMDRLEEETWKALKG